MTNRTRLRALWGVDLPSVGFADSVVARVTAADEAIRREARSSQIASSPHGRGWFPAVDGKLRRAFGLGIAAAATFALYLGAFPGLGSDGRRLEASERERQELQVQVRVLQDELARYKSSERLADVRSVANGGNTAINPEAGANGVW